MQQASLQQLNDIVEPVSANLWPPAWPVLVAIIAVSAMLVGSLLWLIQRYRAKRPQRIALARLKQLQRPSASDITLLCKRLALVYFPRQRVAHLTGQEWLQFIGATRHHEQQLFDNHQALFYQPGQGELIQRYQQLAMAWVKQARQQARNERKGGNHV